VSVDRPKWIASLVSRTKTGASAIQSEPRFGRKRGPDNHAKTFEIGLRKPQKRGVDIRSETRDGRNSHNNPRQSAGSIACTRGTRPNPEGSWWLPGRYALRALSRVDIPSTGTSTVRGGRGDKTEAERQHSHINSGDDMICLCQCGAGENH
jgi:hypothetical protein